MTENKQMILNALLEAIQCTRAGDDVTALRFDSKTETVYVDFENNKAGRKINVAADSGIAMLRDVLNHIDIG